MNDLSKFFLNLNDGETVVLEKNKTYDVRPEDSYYKEGFFCSNTAKKHENPNGYRYAAIFMQGRKNIVIDGYSKLVEPCNERGGRALRVRGVSREAFGGRILRAVSIASGKQLECGAYKKRCA